MIILAESYAHHLFYTKNVTVRYLLTVGALEQV
jgi:hypothetical protein